MPLLERTRPTKIIQTPRTDVLQQQALLARKHASNIAGKGFYFTSEQAYTLTPSGFQLVGMEVLTRILGKTDREPFFGELHAAGKSIPLAIAGLRWALMEIVSGRITHPISINVFAGDFMNPDFGKNVRDVLLEHRKSDRKMIEFELLENGVPETLDVGLIGHCYLGLIKQGALSAIDDFDLGGDTKNNISRLLLKTLYPLGCRKIKLDWKTTRGLLAGDPLLVRALKLLLIEYPGLTIQAEGMRIADNPQCLKENGITQFQGSSFGDL